MMRLPGTDLEVVRCTVCGFEQILSGLACSRCRSRVEELNPVCDECGEALDPLDGEVHTAHEEGCDRGDWCRCDLLCHPACCRECRPPAVIPGQTSLLDAS